MQQRKMSFFLSETNTDSNSNSNDSSSNNNINSHNVDTMKKKAKAGSFQSMGLSSNIMKGLNRMNYKQPTPVQRKALPMAIAGMDLVCMARTGSGKTCVFLLPMLERLEHHVPNSGVRGLVLSPTRELALQSFRFAKDMAKFTDLRIVSIIGGDPIEEQFNSLASHPDVIIATPGRLMHHLREIPTFTLKYVKFLAFDEADRLFEMGFAEQLNEIVRECPEDRQTLLFSATMPKLLAQFSRAGLRDPQLVRLDTDTKMSEELRLAFLVTRTNEKVPGLLYLVRKIIPRDQLTIIFTATRHHSEYIHCLFKHLGLSSTLIYGSMDPEARNFNLRCFRNKEVNFLIVTDLAARGLDVPLLNNVINFHCPAQPKMFVHRCGRAARAGRIGFAFSLVEPDELAYMMDIHTMLGLEMEVVGSGITGDITESRPSFQLKSYTLNTMTPSMVHTGIFPQDVLHEEADSLDRLMRETEELQILWRVASNGMKQYRRTRAEASRHGIKLTKAAIKNNTIKYIHPLIAGEDPDRCNESVLEKANFVQHLQTFRPAQTVFETGIGTGTTGAGFKAKGKSGKVDSQGVQAMRALRREVAPALERNQAKPLTLEECSLGEGAPEGEKDGDGDIADEVDEYDVRDEDGDNNDGDSDGGEDENGDNGGGHGGGEGVNGEEEEPKLKKRRLSRADRKRMKKNGGLPPAQILSSSDDMTTTISEEPSAGFIDSKYYMSYGTEDEVATYREDLLQPQQGLRASESVGAAALETAMLDVIPDDAVEMNRKKKIMRWDAKKRKFVKQTLEEMAQSKRGVHKIRSESGVARHGSSSKPQGQMYNDWKKKTRREVAVTGDEDYSQPRPQWRHNKKVPEELKSAQQIRKVHKERENLRLKNMSKEKRRAVEGQRRKKSSEAQQAKFMTSKAAQRKVKVVMR